jgi:hypothetical protein
MKNISIFFISFFCCAVFTYTATSQSVDIGVRGGISVPNLSAGGSEVNPLNGGYSSRQGPDFGLFADFKVSGLFSIQPMLQYSSQGGKKDGLQALPTPTGFAAQYPTGEAPTYLYAKYNSSAKINYLMLPVLAKFGWNFKSSPWRIYVDAGPFLGYLVSAKQVTSGSSDFYADPAGTEALPAGTQNFDATSDIKDQLNKVNFGFEGNLGLKYKFKRSSIFIEGGGNYGLLNIQKGTANGKNNTGAATADLGYSLALGK